MQPSLDQLRILLVVARERSFTRAAAVLGLPQSSVSRSIRGLENQLGIPLLSRTTRSVAPTEAGERLLSGIGPAMDQIDAEFAQLGTASGQIVGTVRITTVAHAYQTVLRPVLASLRAEHSQLSIEVNIDDGFSDIVAQRFDAGIRFGGLIEKDMIALRVGPDVKVAIVASPGYVAAKGSPSTPEDLLSYDCINYRQTFARGLYRWEMEKDGVSTEVRVDGGLILNDGSAIIDAARDGLGIAYTFRDAIQDDLDAGALVSLLEDWCPTFPGYHIYYPGRSQVSPSLRVLLDRLKRPALDTVVPSAGRKPY
jgi:DNA-binding transcriptional LysR family regulator